MRGLRRLLVTRDRAIGFIAATLAIALVVRFHHQGGPYFTAPETAYDHVSREGHPSAAVIRLCHRVAPLLPRDVTVTLFKPGDAPYYDNTEYSVGTGVLERQRVVAPKLDVEESQLPDFIVAIRDPVVHPVYQLVAKFEDGALYARKR